jgi:TPR repeat protein
MIIYHGSDVIVQKPKILKSNRFLDFGTGFYTTTNKQQAIRWAKKVAKRNDTTVFFVSIYEYNEKEAHKKLKILEFKEADENWLDFVQKNRNGIRTEAYDIVSGPVADDNVYLSIKLFETGVLNKEETLKRLKIRKLYNQILFHSEESLKYCQYKESFTPER